MKIYVLLCLFFLLIALIAYGISGAVAVSAPTSSRATFTPAPIVTPAPTWTPPTSEPAYPAPMDDRRRLKDEGRKATPVPASGLRCGHC